VTGHHHAGVSVYDSLFVGHDLHVQRYLRHDSGSAAVRSCHSRR
jgi:hypothetical protein